MIKPAGYLVEEIGHRDGDPGAFYDYVMAKNGLFVQAHNNLIRSSICIAPADVRGLAPLQEYVQLEHGKIPLFLLRLVITELSLYPAKEQYFCIVWTDADGGRYTIRKPEQSGTPGSVTYEVLPDVIADIHSHVRGIPACFSSQDDKDEVGLALYIVVGDLANLFPTVNIRAGVYGYFMDLEQGDIFV